MCSPATGNGRPRQSPRSRCRRATVRCGVSDTSFDMFDCCAAGFGGSKSCSSAASSSLPMERSAASKRLARGSGNRHSCNPRVVASQSESSPPRSRSPGRKLAGRIRPRVMGSDVLLALSGQSQCCDWPDRARSTAKNMAEAAARQGMQCLHTRAPGIICPARVMRLRLQVDASRPLSLPVRMEMPWCLRLAGTPSAFLSVSKRRYTSRSLRASLSSDAVVHDRGTAGLHGIRPQVCI